MIKSPITHPRQASAVNTYKGIVAALVVMAAVGSVDYAWADHCPSTPYSLKSCDHKRLQMDITVINATQYPTPTGGTELVLWLQLDPGRDPHDYVTITHVATKHPRGNIPEHCIQYPNKHADPLHVTKTQLLKACFFIPSYMDAGDVRQLHASYRLITTYPENSYHIFKKSDTKYATAIRLNLNPESGVIQCEDLPRNNGDEPRAASAAYHIYMNDIIVSFDGMVELAEGWRDHTTILAENGTHTIEVDGMHQNTRNLMSPGSMVWLDLTYSDYRDLKDATEITLRMGPGTILYGDGRTNAGEIVVGLELVP